MLRMMNDGTSGMAATQVALANISNNIANSQTTAYKKTNTNFAEEFYQEEKTASAPSSNYAGTNPKDIGNGVQVASVSTNFSQGSITNTGNKNDLAIQGDGFFVVGDKSASNKMYTRAGNFTLSQDNKLVTGDGQYVLGWNMDKITGAVSTGAALSPISLALGQISQPKETTQILLNGNIDGSMKIGDTYGLQVPSYDRLGVTHDIDVNFVKTGDNKFKYVMTPVDQFKSSASVDNAVLRTSSAIAGQLQKGDYKINATPSATAGQVDLSVVDPSGNTVLTQTITDANQNVTLTDSTGNPWFSVDYKSGAAPSNATFTIGEVGDLTFNSVGQVSGMTGSGPNGKPEITYTPSDTGNPVNININMDNLTGVAADSGVTMTSTDGSPAATLETYSISDGGIINGYYTDGSIKPIGQIALANFANPEGLSKTGAGYYSPTASSGLPNIGMANTAGRGQIKAEALEMSNVDLSTEFVDMMTTEKSFQANTKVIRSADTVLSDIINLIQ